MRTGFQRTLHVAITNLGRNIHRVLTHGSFLPKIGREVYSRASVWLFHALCDMMASYRECCNLSCRISNSIVYMRRNRTEESE